MKPEELLFTEKDGVRTSLQDVIYDGLDRDYSDRFPALLTLMQAQESQPAHRLYACVMLASWGVPEGLHMLIQWAGDPASTPWADEPVTFDRFFGVDSAFEMLADATRVVADTEHIAEVAPLRTEAVKALLGIYDQVYFARSLMVVLDLDSALAASLKAEIASAVDRAIEASINDTKIPFDMPTQAAFLLGPLAALDDACAAQAAEKLIAAHPDNSRTIREVAFALSDGTGPATRAILERLAASPFQSVRKDAEDSLSRRARANVEGTR